MRITKLFLAIIIGSLLVSCGGKKFKKNPVDDLVKAIPTDSVFSIVLDDMDVNGSFFEHYFHQYKIITHDKDGKPVEKVTEWKEVSKDYFAMHTDDMGMEIVARGEDGKLTKSVNPPGYSNYVGNSKYGSWEQRNGSSFWAFYGQYAFMSSMFNMGRYPVQRSYYNDWRGNYYGTGRTYYGPTGTSGRYYGTGSAYNSTSRPNSTWSSNRSRFKNRVQSRTSRSSSRYGGSSSSSRSRGGGFGK